MNKKIISSILIVALFNLFGCATTSTQTKTPGEYIWYEKENGKPNEIFLVTNNNEKYHLTSWNYNIEDNSFWGSGYLINGNEEPTLLRIPFTTIRLIQWEEYHEGSTNTTVLIVAASLLLLVIIIYAGMASSIGSAEIKSLNTK